MRAGQGELAVSLIREIYTAVRTRTDAVIDGIEVPTSTMTGDEASHQEIRRWPWAVMLATTARVLASIDHWIQAQEAQRSSNQTGSATG